MSMTVTATTEAAAPASRSRELSPGQAAILQLLPGLALLPAYAILSWIMAGRGIPAILALMISILVVEVPVSWIIMIRRVRQETGGSFSLEAAFPWMEKVPWWAYLFLGLPAILFSMILMGGAARLLGGLLREAVFPWVPAWFVMDPDPAMFSGLPRGLVMAVWALGLPALVLAGGTTQELLSRGFLLPRTAHWGGWAPAFNALLFTVFHLIAPWSWPGFFVSMLPWAYLVWWRRSVKIGLFIHVGMLALQWLGMTLLAFGLAPPPPGG